MAEFSVVPIPLKSHLHLHAIYTAARKLVGPPGKGEIMDGRFIMHQRQCILDGLDGAAIESIESTLQSIIDIAEFDHRFEVTFIELSMYDPDDELMESFCSVLCGPRLEAIENYRKVVIENMKSASNPFVGPLVPNIALYRAPLYFIPADGAVHCDSLCHVPQNVFVGAFRQHQVTDLDAYEDDQEFLKAKDYACNAFARTAKLLACEDGHARLDVCLMVPFSRPASLGLPDYRQQVRGGVLFIYGQVVSPDFDQYQVALVLSAALSRALLADSEHRNQALRKHWTQGLIMHHVKNRLGDSVAVPDCLNEIRTLVEKVKVDLRGVAILSPTIPASVSRLTAALEASGQLEAHYRQHIDTASEFRALFDLLAQSTVDFLEHTRSRIDAVLSKSNCRLERAVQYAKRVSPRLQFLVSKGASVWTRVELPGSAMIYEMIFGELIRNAAKVGASVVDLRLLGENWADEPPNHRAKSIWLELLDDAASDGGTSEESVPGAGLDILKGFIEQVLGGLFHPPEKRTDGRIGSVIRICLPTPRAFHSED